MSLLKEPANSLTRFAEQKRLYRLPLPENQNSTASLAFKDENDKILAEVLYDLYTGTPSSVISDPENDRKIILKVEAVFSTFEKLNSRFGEKEKS